MSKDPTHQMAKYLDALIGMASKEDEPAQVQLMFEPGMQMAAGGLKHAVMPDGSPAHGLYQLLTVGQPGKDAPQGTPDYILLSQVFPASAVQRVIIQAPLPESMRPSSLVVPNGAGKLSGPGGMPRA